MAMQQWKNDDVARSIFETRIAQASHTNDRRLCVCVAHHEWRTESQSALKRKEHDKFFRRICVNEKIHGRKHPHYILAIISSFTMLDVLFCFVLFFYSLSPLSRRQPLGVFYILMHPSMHTGTEMKTKLERKITNTVNNINNAKKK